MCDGGQRSETHLSSAAVLLALDLKLLRLLRTHGHTPAAERAVLLFTRCGEHGGLWLAIAAVGVLLHPGRRHAYRRAFLVVLMTLVANATIKRLIRRARPVLEDLPALSPTFSRLSYPSAHSSTSFAGAAALSEALPSPPLHAAAAAMALSRFYVGVHYPTDVLAGAALGAALGRAAR